MSLRTRIWIVLLLAAALVLGTGAALRSGYRTVAETADMTARRLQPASDTVADLNTALAEMDSGANSYALTGDITDLGTYIEAATRASNEFRALRVYLRDNPELTAQLNRTRDAANRWRREGTGPIIAAARSGSRDDARALVRSGTSRMLYDETRTYNRLLGQEIRDNVDDAVAEEEEQFTLLWWVLNGSIVVLVVLLALFASLLLRGVLRPLRDLRRQLIASARTEHRETPIVPSGPPELRQVGQDAEQMRRQLVAEIDRARQADEGLEQEKPLLAAIRAELSDTHALVVPGLDLYGEQQPAQGVMAGDWWSAQRLSDGRLAVTITDVSGHGPAAGIEALRLKHVIELSLAQHAEPALALEAAAAGFRDPARFATCAVVVIDAGTGLLTWANAGHLPPWLVGPGSTTELVPTGPLLSVLGGTWVTEQSQLDIGAMLVLWTDGVTESHDDRGAELDEDGLAGLIADALAVEETSAGFARHVLSAARSRATDWRRDDVTFVAVQRI